MDIVHIITFVVGAGIVLVGSFWAMAIFLDQGKEPPYAARLAFTAVRDVMYGLSKFGVARKFREYLLSLYLPVSLLAIVIVSLISALIGYTFMFHGLRAGTMHDAYIDSASSLSVLGIGGSVGNIPRTTLALIEAFTGPILVALLIGYLASINSTFARQESRVRKLRKDRGNKDWAAGILEQLAGDEEEERLISLFDDWSVAFDELEAGYRTLDGYLLIFSPGIRDSHVHVAGTVLDAAALRNSVVDRPESEPATQCIESGSRALAAAAAHFGNGRTSRGDRGEETISSKRNEFNRAIDELAAHGIPVHSDRDISWQKYSQLSGEYETVLSMLLHMTHSEATDLAGPD